MSFKKLIPLAVIILVAACSHKVDTSQMTAEEHMKYAMQLFTDEDYSYSIPEFQSLLLNSAGSPIYGDAQYYLAMSYYNSHQYYLAAYEFSKLIRDLPASPHIPDAQYMLAESYYNQSPIYSLDQAFSKKAIEEYQAFINYFPTNEKVAVAEKKIKELNEKLAEKEFYAALQYERMEYYVAAIKYYGSVADGYHDTKFAPEALYNKMKLELERGENQKVLNDVSVFLHRYPDNPLVKDVKEIEGKVPKS